MQAAQKKYEIDMTVGPLFKNILRFSFPLILTGILQVFYNAADVIVVGRFAGIESLAAVGSTSSVISLFLSLFAGFSVGAAVLVSRGFGSHDAKLVSDTVHTSILFSLISGVVVAVAGVSFARQALLAMGSPEDVIDKASLYMRIYFIGTPSSITYSFGSAVLRSVGDTKRPLYFGAISGVVNVVLNLIFVIVFHMDVVGVAAATIIAQALSAVLVVRCLAKSDGLYKLDMHKLKIHKSVLKDMVLVGLPAGIQSSLFSVSNILIQSSVNIFGSTVMAGNAAATGAANFIYIAQNAFLHTALTATAQNYGAKNKSRIKESIGVSCLAVTAVGLVMGVVMLIFARPILSIYSHDPDVLEMAQVRAAILFPTYFMCGIMEALVGGLRGLGSSIVPMITSLIGVCGLRILWIYTVFAQFMTPQILYWSHPVSWVITAAAHLICLVIVFKKKTKDFSL